jgi:hypothetical protein
MIFRSSTRSTGTVYTGRCEWLWLLVSAVREEPAAALRNSTRIPRRSWTPFSSRNSLSSSWNLLGRMGTIEYIIYIERMRITGTSTSPRLNLLPDQLPACTAVLYSSTGIILQIANGEDHPGTTPDVLSKRIPHNTVSSIETLEINQLLKCCKYSPICVGGEFLTPTVPLLDAAFSLQQMSNVSDTGSKI